MTASKKAPMLRLEATIPSTQYGNIRPTFEMEGGTPREVIDTGMQYIKELWETYGEKPLNENKVDRAEPVASLFKRIETFTGEVIYYDDLNHKYKDEKGNELISASTYKKQFEKPFATDIISAKVASSMGIDVDVVQKMWSNNSRISRTFGNAVHYAMEQYWLHAGYDTGDKNYHLPKHPILRKAVEDFPEFDHKTVKPEVFVSNVKEGTVGQIDAIHLLDKKSKTINIWDYKSDAELEEKGKLKLHQIQLMFYAGILQAFGWNVDKLIVWNYTDKWTPYECETFDLKELEDKIKK